MRHSEQGRKRKKRSNEDVLEHLFLTFPEPERTEIDGFKKFGDGHEIYEAVTFFATKGLVAEVLRVQEM